MEIFETNIYYSPSQIFKVKVDEGPEFRMGAYRRTFTIPFSFSGIEVFHTVNGAALFLNDQFLIVAESKLAILLDLVNKITYHSREHYSFKLDKDEVRILSNGSPPVFRCKVENIIQYFQTGFVDPFDGRFPQAIECWPD